MSVIRVGSCLFGLVELLSRRVHAPGSLSVRRTDCSKLAPYVDDHNRRHDQGGNVRYTGGARVDEGVGHVDCPTVALRHDARRPRQGILRSDQGTDWQRRLCAYCLKVSKPHLGGGGGDKRGPSCVKEIRRK